MSKKTILNSSRWGALTLPGCALLLASGGAAAALPADRNLGPRIDCQAFADGPRSSPSTRPPARDRITGRLVDMPDRWVLRGLVITPPY